MTCNVYERRVTELSAEEWARVFESLGKAPTWMTFSGGEPFLRADLPDIIISAMRSCEPTIVNIPTNGWFTERILEGVTRICRADPHTQLVINLSFDHHEPGRHDAIRVKEGSYEKLLETLAGLRGLQLPNLTVGVHSVVSRANEEEFPDIAKGLGELHADSYICEPAEERVELMTMGLDITPRKDTFKRAAAAVEAADDANASGMVARIARTIRREYYDRVADLLGGDTNAMPVCHAGFISAHIGADGDVWPCCVVARPLGNVRDAGLDFKKVWSSPAAHAWRAELRETRCTCPLANAAYTNLLVEPKTVAKVAAEIVRRPRNGSHPV